MKKVLCFGSFDILHEGHKSYLKQAQEHGRVYVVVARDVNIEKFKKKSPKNNESSRLLEVQKLEMVEEAVLGGKDNIFNILNKIRPDVICLGYDQTTASEQRIHDELEKRGLKAKIIRAKPFKEDVYKSSKLRS